jgi:hypothetical protein
MYRDIDRSVENNHSVEIYKPFQVSKFCMEESLPTMTDKYDFIPLHLLCVLDVLF